MLYDEDGAVKGVATGNMGVGKDGEPGANFQLGMELHAKYTFFAEGARGHLGKQVIAKYALDAGRDPQTWGIGIKEVWELAPGRHVPGLVLHSAGWPLDSSHLRRRLHVPLRGQPGLARARRRPGLQQPLPEPFQEFQRYKTHPAIRAFLEGGKRIAYGARAINASGLQSLPKLVFPGGALVGCDAGFLNAPRIKGSHAAIKTGMLAADAAFDAVAAGRQRDELAAYPAAFESELAARRAPPRAQLQALARQGAGHRRRCCGASTRSCSAARRRGRCTASQADHEKLKPAAECTPIEYPKPDGKITFDKLSSVFLSNTNHEENQPAHLTLKDASVPVAINLARYAGPESRYCPAGVYEFVKTDAGADRLQINAQNCVHCKTCDIKDPTQNIVWVTPEGGGGPNYASM